VHLSASSPDEIPAGAFLVTRNTDETVVALRGEFDAFDVAAISDLIRGTASDVVVDVAAVTFVDSAFLFALVALHDECVGRGVRCRIVDATGPVRHVCDALGVDPEIWARPF